MAIAAQVLQLGSAHGADSEPRPAVQLRTVPPLRAPDPTLQPPGPVPGAYDTTSAARRVLTRRPTRAALQQAPQESARDLIKRKLLVRPPQRRLRPEL